MEEKVQTLVLARLYARGEPETRRDLGARLHAFRAHVNDWDRRLDGAIEVLVARGAVARVGRAALALTESGATRAREALGLASAGGTPSWRRVRDDILPRRMASLPPVPKGEEPSAERLQASIIARAESLPASSLAEVGNALVWRALGVESARPLSKTHLLAHVLHEALGGSRVRAPDAALRMLAGKLAGARRSDPTALRDAIARAWLAGDRGAASDTATAPDEPLEAFAARVNEAASMSPDGWFGEDKVFISHVLRALGGDPAASKRRLVEAQRAGLVRLSRADLVEAMSPEDVRASEITHLDTTFHFVRADRRSP